MDNTQYLEMLRLVLPEAVLVLAALVVLVFDLGFLRDAPVARRQRVCAAVPLAGCIGAALLILVGRPHGELAQGILSVGPLSNLGRMSVLGLGVLTILLSVESRFTNHVGEYYLLLLLALVGMMMLVASENLLLIFVALELTSLSLYLMTAFDRESATSAEAGFKYFLFGGVSAAFTLFGISLIYGLSGQIDLRELAGTLATMNHDPLFLVAVVMTIVGFGFKVAAVPFHLWAPDVYEGAPTPAAALVASGSKVASFLVLARIVMVGMAGAGGSAGWRSFESGWIPLLAVLAAASLVLGNLTAIVQQDVKRLLAYSAVAHAGYALLGVVANDRVGVAALVYYVVTYAVATVGAFGVVSLVEREVGGSRLTDFAGLARRSPVLGACLLIFMLSLAGIPPLAGFFGKFFVFVTAVGAAENLGLLWLVILAIAMSAVSLYYYLQVLKQAFVVPEIPGLAARDEPISFAGTAVVAAAVLVVGLGCFPEWLVERLLEAVRLAGI